MAEKNVQSRKRKIDSIDTLKKENTYLPNSPKKCSNTIQCAVLTKSPLKPTTKGQLFAMRLCDEDPAVNARAICYNPEIFPAFQPMKTYTIQRFKVKKGYGNESMEIEIDNNTIIESSDRQFKIERSTFDIAQIVRGEAQNIRYLNVKAKIMDIGEVSKVGRFPDLKEKREIVIADKSGHMTLILWRDRAHDIKFGVGDTVNIENCVVSTFNKVHNLTTAFETTITKVTEDIEVTSPMSTKPKPTSVTQTISKVTGIKDYQCKVKCPNCSTETDIDAASCTTTDVGCITKCRICNTIFMANYDIMYHVCKFLINGSWYIAKKSVVEDLLGKTQHIENPSGNQILKLMNTTFTLTLDECAKKIEAAQPLSDDDPNVNTQEEPTHDENPNVSNEAPQPMHDDNLDLMQQLDNLLGDNNHEKHKTD